MDLMRAIASGDKQSLIERDQSHTKVLWVTVIGKSGRIRRRSPFISRAKGCE
jgi:hypothetical protein